MEKIKFCIFGSGYLGGIVAKAWCDGFLPDYELTGICGRNAEKTKALCETVKVPAAANLEELLERNPRIVVEAASVAAVRQIAEAVVSRGMELATLSIGAFADRDFYDRIAAAARAGGGRVHIASGAVGGFDVLRTISLMGQAQASFETHKGPNSLKNTPLYEDSLQLQPKQVFSGSAAQAIAQLPTKVNVAVAASLATTGPENIQVSIHSEPGFVGDNHKITAEIPGYRTVVDTYSETSSIAGWSVVALLQNLASPIMF